ncbi:MAG: hypothetical protein OXF23_01825, partial [Candidatus Dadabacteria bacterium]|nr:hypothetical protein [Candidatus Dadabacteria bacterium]
ILSKKGFPIGSFALSIMITVKLYEYFFVSSRVSRKTKRFTTYPFLGIVSLCLGISRQENKNTEYTQSENKTLCCIVE